MNILAVRISSAGLLSLLLVMFSCSTQDQPEIPEESIAPCEMCDGSDQASLNLIADNNGDTLLLISLEARFFTSESEIYGLCTNHDSLLQVIQHEDVIAADVLIYNQCEQAQYLELLAFENILHCHPPVDTTALPREPTDVWRVQRFNHTFIPCELETTYLLSGILEDNAASSLQVFGLVASTQIREDSIFLFGQIENADVELTTKGQSFRRELTDFFSVGSPDTTKLLFNINQNFLIFTNPVTGDSLITYQ